jgi:two-component system, chemotaxis family, sensor kinase CheA
MDMDSALQTFIIESRELLQAMEAALLRIEHEAADSDAINAIFRAAHTIKGSAGLFGLDDIVAFTHVAESVLDRVRSNEVVLDNDLASLFLLSCDQISALVDHMADGNDKATPDLLQKSATLIDQLNVYLGVSAAAKTTAATPAVREPALENLGGHTVETDNWHISVRFGSDVLRNGMDPLSFIRYLKTMGEIVAVSTIADTLPAAATMDPESCYLGFEISFKSTADKAAIEGVFEFVRDDCQLHILPPRSRIFDYIELIRAMSGEELRLGEILVKCGTLTEQELQDGLNFQHTLSEQVAVPIGAILVDGGSVQPAVVEAAL